MSEEDKLSVTGKTDGVDGWQGTEAARKIAGPSTVMSAARPFSRPPCTNGFARPAVPTPCAWARGPVAGAAFEDLIERLPAAWRRTGVRTSHFRNPKPKKAPKLGAFPGLAGVQGFEPRLRGSEPRVITIIRHPIGIGRFLRRCAFL